MIPPALTPEEWFAGYRPPDGPADPAALIALANAALPDDDPRKITWDTVRILRQAAEASKDHYGVKPFVDRLADALASYLPPREGKP